jgi:hypothetical protein
MPFKIYRDEVPDEVTTERYIFDKTGSYEKWKKIKDKIKCNKFAFKLENYDHELLKKDTLEALDKYQFRGWQTNFMKSRIYGGLSFLYNKEHQDGIDPEGSTLGTPKNGTQEFFYAQTENHEKLKDSYFDTYGFVDKTGLYNYGYIKKFLEEKSLRSLTRSRLAVMKAHTPNKFQSDLNWHRDEHICVNLRLNIPITTTPEYMFQMENEEPYHLDIGNAYSWDTNVPHRVLLLKPEVEDRANFVLGYSPWFDYDEDNRCWIQNDFWGKHPFQMLLDGEIFKDLSLIEMK